MLRRCLAAPTSWSALGRIVVTGLCCSVPSCSWDLKHCRRAIPSPRPLATTSTWSTRSTNNINGFMVMLADPRRCTTPTPSSAVIVIVHMLVKFSITLHLSYTYCKHFLLMIILSILILLKCFG